MEIREGITFKLNKKKDWYNIGTDRSYFKIIFKIKNVDKIKKFVTVTWVNTNDDIKNESRYDLRSVEFNFRKEYWIPQIKLERKEKLEKITNGI